LVSLLPQAEAAPLLAPVPERTELMRDWRVPLVDSQAGVGAPSAAGVKIAVPLPGLPAGHDGALVRVSVLGASQTTTLTAGGAPALTAQAGSSASTTVLLPVVEGRVALKAGRDADVRLGLLASFAGDPTAPGSVVTLAEPCARAETAGEGLRGAGLGTAGTNVTLVGAGGVPA
jgi:hypothetical protein